MLQIFLQSRPVVQQSKPLLLMNQYVEQARYWGETYESRNEADITPDIGSRPHSMNGSTPGLLGPQPLSTHLPKSMNALCCLAAHLPKM